jgi:hypothetical protein
MDSLHVKRIGIEDLVSYVYIVKVDACARGDLLLYAQPNYTRWFFSLPNIAR